MTRKSTNRAQRALTPKAVVAKLLAQMPDDSTIEDIQYSIYVRDVLNDRIAGMAKADAIPQKEIRSRVSKWIGTR